MVNRKNTLSCQNRSATVVVSRCFNPKETHDSCAQLSFASWLAFGQTGGLSLVGLGPGGANYVFSLASRAVQPDSGPHCKSSQNIALKMVRYSIIGGGDPSSGYSILADNVRRCACFPRWKCPASSAWPLVVQLALPPHGHLHNSNSDEVGVFSHFALTGPRHGVLGDHRLLLWGLRRLRWASRGVWHPA